VAANLSALLAVNDLTINLTPERVDDSYLKVLIVTQAVVAEMLSKLLAVFDGLEVAFQVDPDPVSHRDTILHIEKELLHAVPLIVSKIEICDATTDKDVPRCLGPNDGDEAFQ
jgi:hypothetical protein